MFFANKIAESVPFGSYMEPGVVSENDMTTVVMKSVLGDHMTTQ